MIEHKCSKEEIIDILREDIHEIKSDVKVLLEIKNKMLGIVIVIGLISSLIGPIISRIFKF